MYLYHSCYLLRHLNMNNESVVKSIEFNFPIKFQTLALEVSKELIFKNENISNAKRNIKKDNQSKKGQQNFMKTSPSNCYIFANKELKITKK